MNGLGKGKSCKGEGGLLFLLPFSEKKSEGHGQELWKIWIGKLLRHGGTLSWFYLQWQKEYRSIDTGQQDGRTRIGGFVYWF